MAFYMYIELFPFNAQGSKQQNTKWIVGIFIMFSA